MTESGTDALPRPDEAARRQFWREHMDRSYELVQAMASYDVQECGETLASIPAAVTAAGVEIVFSETKIAGHLDRIFFVRESLLPDLIQIGREMNERGWVLKIEDGFRTLEMQTELGRSPAVFDTIVRICRWECGGELPPPDLFDRRSTCLVANYPTGGTHLMGAAVDITVLRRDDGSEVWRGAPYIHMSEITPMDCPFLSEEERRNRREITELMERLGFMHYPGEFWHYNKGDAGYQLLAKTGKPAKYGPIHWDRATGTVTPFDDLTSPFTPPEMMAANVRAALERLEAAGSA
jgi:D-alanyl-D-alanine dipeptidase